MPLHKSHTNHSKHHTMKTYTVFYTGNNSRIRKVTEIDAKTEREAIESVYRHWLESEFFPMADGSVKDHEGCIVRKVGENEMRHDGGLFWAIEQ